MTRDQVARQFLGVPFRHQGRNPKIGIDCIGLASLWVSACNLLDNDGAPLCLRDNTNYSQDPHDGLLEKQLDDALGPRLQTHQMQPGDIGVVDYKGVIRHVGIIAQGPGYLTFIHTNGDLKKVTEARIDAKWFKRIKGVYRPQGEMA